jgi:hypothetical protein
MQAFTAATKLLVYSPNDKFTFIVFNMTPFVQINSTFFWGGEAS